MKLKFLIIVQYLPKYYRINNKYVFYQQWWMRGWYMAPVVPQVKLIRSRSELGWVTT